MPLTVYFSDDIEDKVQDSILGLEKTEQNEMVRKWTENSEDILGNYLQVGYNSEFTSAVLDIDDEVRNKFMSEIERLEREGTLENAMRREVFEAFLQNELELKKIRFGEQ